MSTRRSTVACRRGWPNSAWASRRELRWERKLGNRAATSSATSRRRTRPADFVGIARAYAETAIEDSKGERFGKWIRLAAKRFIADLLRAQRKRRPPFLWSPARANRACEFIQLLPHVEGSWSTSTIKLEPAQVFFIVQLFGFRNFDGTRRLRRPCLRSRAKMGS